MSTEDSQSDRLFGETFGDIVWKMRKKIRRVTLEKFESILGLSSGHMSDIERGKVEPSRRIVERAAEALEIDLDGLLGSAGMIRKEYGPAILRFPNVVVTMFQMLLSMPYEVADQINTMVGHARKVHRIGCGSTAISRDSLRAVLNTYADALNNAAKVIDSDPQDS